jgi:SAM-dependent methyltransferase
VNAPERPAATGPILGPQSFDAYYFTHCCGKPYVRNEEWLSFFRGIADRIVSDIAPKRVLDAGCAMGFLVEVLRDRGVDATGIDISPFAVEHLHETVKAFCRLGSVTEELAGVYDLIVAIELVEHMPAREAEIAIANFCRHTNDVLFSSSPFDYQEPTHINVHPPEYWAEAFARHGFFRDVEFDASFITPWAVRFRRSSEPLHHLVRRYERRYWELFQQAHGARTHSMEVQSRLAALEAEEAQMTEAREVVIYRDELVIKLSQALHTISNMERSKFWKLRLAWVRLRGLFGR